MERSPVFDLSRDQALLQLNGHKDAVLALAVGMDGARAITTSKDGMLIAWDLKTGKAIAQLSGHRGAVISVVVTHDFRTAFSISSTGELIRWDLNDGMEVRRFTGHKDMVYDVAVMPDGRRLVSVSGSANPSVSSQDTSLRVWNIQTGAQLGKVSMPAPVLFQVAVSPDGKLILANNLVFDADTLTKIGVLQGHKEGVLIPAIDISPDGLQAITGASDGTLILWDLSSLKPVRQISLGSQSGIWAVSFGKDGHTALVDSDTSIIDLWDPVSGERIRGYTTEDVSTGVGTSAAVFHPDGKSVFAAAPDGMIYQFDLENGTLLGKFGPHNDIRTRIEIGADGKLMLTSGMDGVLMLWNLKTRELIRRFGTPGYAIFDITMGKDGQTAFSGSADTTIIQWQMSNPSLNELRDWIAANRFVRDVSCDEQKIFGIQNQQGKACLPAANPR